MLDFADFVAINKFDRKGAQDAWRDVAKQMQRNREQWHARAEDMPVYGTQASRFNDDGVTMLYLGLREALAQRGLVLRDGTLPRLAGRQSTGRNAIVPPARSRYLAELADTVRAYHKRVAAQSAIARERQQLREARRMLTEASAAAGADAQQAPQALQALETLEAARDGALGETERALLAGWPALREAYSGDEHVVTIRGKDLRTGLVTTTLSGTRLRKVVLPRFTDEGELLRWLMRENLPGYFPYTAGVFPFKRENEDPTRMFAGEGDAFRTNRRFKLVSEGMPAKRLSTAFDSVTLYGEDPDLRPDIYGKVGNSGVSIATLDDMKVLYDGFDLIDPQTSVSMTINGPAPAILAMFMNTAIDQQLDRFRREQGREPDAGEAAKIRAMVLQNVRGTVQADILKEDQGQNTCIFSTEFSLKVMGDIQQYFVDHQVRNFYSVSISGYHIAEAGANPISQLAFTLANGFTYVEAYLARGMHIDDFAPNLSFFFSNGMDPRVQRAGPRRAPHLGRHAARQVRGERAQPEAEVPHPDLRPLAARAGDRLQRHPHHAAGADRDLRQLQFAAHQRLRRGHHHADRGVGAARAGDPADHQSRMGRRQVREPEPGQLPDRGTDRPGGGGGAAGVRADRRARRRARRDGDRLPAREDPGRVDALRAAQARWLAADHRRQYLPQSRRRSDPGHARAGALQRGREAEPAAAAARRSTPAMPTRRRRCWRGCARP
ncbi:hypothetical protein OJJOAM_001507 [Cupriavidus sp. H18C1]